jgi:hypothetical protein
MVWDFYFSEPLSEWQMVQDDTTQYYYYWNVRSNQVTWEIPPGYTQFLLLYKEYEEKMARIPPEKLERLKQKKADKNCRSVRKCHNHSHIYSPKCTYKEQCHQEFFCGHVDKHS